MWQRYVIGFVLRCNHRSSRQLSQLGPLNRQRLVIIVKLTSSHMLDVFAELALSNSDLGGVLSQLGVILLCTLYLEEAVIFKLA